MVKKNKKL